MAYLSARWIAAIVLVLAGYCSTVQSGESEIMETENAASAQELVDCINRNYTKSDLLQLAEHNNRYFTKHLREFELYRDYLQIVADFNELTKHYNDSIPDETIDTANLYRQLDRQEGSLIAALTRLANIRADVMYYGTLSLVMQIDINMCLAKNLGMDYKSSFGGDEWYLAMELYWCGRPGCWTKDAER